MSCFPQTLPLGSSTLERRVEELEEVAEADLFPSLSRVKVTISSARIIISGKNTCSLQRTKALGQHQRHSRATATGIKVAHATIKNLLGLPVFALDLFIYIYFICFPLKFGIFCLIQKAHSMVVSVSLELCDQPGTSTPSKPLVQNNSKQRSTSYIHLLEINWVCKLQI